MKSFERLVRAFRRLPGVGPKQAERLALHVLRSPQPEADELAESVRQARERTRACRECLNYTESELCPLCADPGRDRALLCVVEQPSDISAIERSRAFSGVYHVLHGALSPLDGIGTDKIRVKELMERLERGRGSISEVILATDPDTEGEATAIYLTQLMRPFSLRVSRIAQGLPLGGNLDYTDELTLSMALNARRTL